MTTNTADTKKSRRKKLWKIVGAICGVIAILWMISDAQKGVEKASEWHGLDSEIQLVQSGHFSDYPDKTIGEAVDGFIRNPKWESVEDQEEGTLVKVSGHVFQGEKPVEIMIQFVVDTKNKTFYPDALELDGMRQAESELITLLNKMLE